MVTMAMTNLFRNCLDCNFSIEKKRLHYIL